MDRDTTSIGGIENPLQPTKQLFFVTLMMDVISVLLSFIISPQTAVCIFTYIIFSHLYSYRKIRLKKFPVIGYLVVILNQGGLIFYTVYKAVTNQTNPPLLGMICATLLIGGFYPITQIYQHRDDANDNVKTISMVLGKNGTFIFCSIVYAVAFGLLFYYYNLVQQPVLFFVLMLFFIPVLVYFMVWFLQVKRDGNNADFKHTMRMNKIASVCTNLAFITILIIKKS